MENQTPHIMQNQSIGHVDITQCTCKVAPAWWMDARHYDRPLHRFIVHLKCFRDALSPEIAARRFCFGRFVIVGWRFRKGWLSCRGLIVPGKTNSIERRPKWPIFSLIIFDDHSVGSNLLFLLDLATHCIRGEVSQCNEYCRLGLVHRVHVCRYVPHITINGTN